MEPPPGRPAATELFSCILAKKWYAENMEPLFTRSGVQREANRTSDKGAPLFVSKRPCTRCGGAGGAEAWNHTGWTCYRCGGKCDDPVPSVEKLYTAEKLEKLNAAKGKRDAKKAAAAAEKQAEEAARALRERDDVLAHYQPLLARIRSAVPVKTDDDGYEADPLEGDGFLASMYRQITVQHRWLTERQQEALDSTLTKIETEKARVKAATFLGEIGVRTEFTLTLEKVVTWGDRWTGITYLCIFKTEEGSKVLYRGSSPHSLGLKGSYDPRDGEFYFETGQTVRVKAMVKEHKHSKYNGEPETWIARPKALEPEAA